MDNNNNSNNQQNDCIIAKDIILTKYAQIARIIMMTFNSIPLIIFFLTISDPNGLNPCAMLCPLWYALLSRGFGFVFSFSLPLLHFCAVLERWRATKCAKKYENENRYFGIFIVIIVMIISLIYFIFYAYIVLDDFNMEWNKMLAYNATVTIRSNILTIYQTYFMLFVLALTILGDYLLLRKNGKMRKMVFNIANQRQQINGYSLAENYQFNENLLAIRFIFPLDIAYGLTNSIYFGLVIILRSFQPIISFSVFLANYNLITILQLLYISTAFIFFRRYINYNRSGRRNHLTSIPPSEQLGKKYFEQLNIQWN
uniref:G_PROTEIN_RECEP_F1_2 domain-containing protein n=1 Tax=Meloidogyne hapla TaxID=6305 RepID=A0A1I8BBC4_MELHA